MPAVPNSRCTKSLFFLCSRRVGEWSGTLRLAPDHDFVGPRHGHTAILPVCVFQGTYHEFHQNRAIEPQQQLFNFNSRLCRSTKGPSYSDLVDCYMAGPEDLVSFLQIIGESNVDFRTNERLSFCIAGIFFVLPCIESYQKVDLRTITLGVPPQEVSKGFLPFSI